MKCASLMVTTITMVLFGAAAGARAASSTSSSTYTDLHGKRCHEVDSSSRGSTRQCPGVRGYSLLIYDDDDRTSVDIVTPSQAVYPLSFWDVVTPGYAVVGQKAQWQLGRRRGKEVPTALTLRLTRLDKHNSGELITVARIDADGACVVFRSDALAPNAVALATKAAANRASKCLGALQDE